MNHTFFSIVSLKGFSKFIFALWLAGVFAVGFNWGIVQADGSRTVGPFAVPCISGNRAKGITSWTGSGNVSYSGNTFTSPVTTMNDIYVHLRMWHTISQQLPVFDVYKYSSSASASPNATASTVINDIAVSRHYMRYSISCSPAIYYSSQALSNPGPYENYTYWSTGYTP